MKQHLRKGSYRDLNLYYMDQVWDDVKMLGMCEGPEPDIREGDDPFILDGCMIVAETVLGGIKERWNLGGTAIHEVRDLFEIFKMVTV
jgi:hypothetical protein